MRTKAILLSALVGLASTAAVMAQTNVYSLNAVGYVNVTVAPGWNIVANPLNAATNSISALLPTAEPGVQVFKFNGASYDIATMDEFDLVWYFNGNPVSAANRFDLNPGEAFFIRNSASTNWVFTFVGEVPQGTLVNTFPVGFSMRSSIVPQSISVTNLAFAQPGDQCFKMVNNGYQIATFDEFDLVWYYNGNPVSASNPFNFNVGEGFYYKNVSSATETWSRVFSVNN